ncbi:MAG: hypothetical protein WBQ64_20885 [Terriglobales bacterium]
MGRTLLSDAFDFDLVFDLAFDLAFDLTFDFAFDLAFDLNPDFLHPPRKIKIKIKGVGQECPTPTTMNRHEP